MQCEGNLRDYRALAIRLDQIPLTENELFELTQRLRRIHSIAMDWKAEEKINDDVLRDLVHRAEQERAEIALPRFVVTATIGLLENLHQNPNLSPIEAMKEVLGETGDIISAQERQRHRPWEGA